MFILGVDIGSSSIKASLFDAAQGSTVAIAMFPPEEMQIVSVNKDWAEQDPETWVKNLSVAMQILSKDHAAELKEVGAIGITYQMHGLVMIDKAGKLVRNSIIWCDSRATEIGDRAFRELGETYCLSHFLNSPGNFTASKLRWVKLHEPGNYNNIDKIMLPGDYVAFRLTGEARTSYSGLSEGIFWDFEENRVSEKLLDYYGISPELIPGVVETFSIQGHLTKEMADKLGLKPGIPVAYRAGDQPNNAFSLNVLQPGEIAATAGTSGVVYGVTDSKDYDLQSRVNTFLHVNNSVKDPRYGILMCLNSTGILNAWARRELAGNGYMYDAINELASGAPVGAAGLRVFPFGNGAERILQNKNLGASFSGLNFNIHGREHLFRAIQEGIVFALYYGVEIMTGMGLDIRVIRAGHENMFLSPLFRQTLADLSGASIELYQTNGAEGAARGAGIGAGYYHHPQEAFKGLKKIDIVEPIKNDVLIDTYQEWKNTLVGMMNNEP